MTENLGDDFIYSDRGSSAGYHFNNRKMLNELGFYLEQLMQLNQILEIPSSYFELSISENILDRSTFHFPAEPTQIMVNICRIPFDKLFALCVQLKDDDENKKYSRYFLVYGFTESNQIMHQLVGYIPSLTHEKIDLVV